MARKTNPQESIKVQPVIAAQMHDHLVELVALGYGNTPTEVARHLIVTGVDPFLKAGLIGPGVKRRIVKGKVP